MWEYLKKSCNKINQIFNQNICELIRANCFFSLLILIISISTLMLFCINKSENIPALWLSGFALGFSYNAYIYTKEKFRLDLLDKRWEIYENTLEFCSLVTQYGSLTPTGQNDEKINQAIQAAHESFRGIGYHKTRALFGKDIYQLFEKLNESYAFLRSNIKAPSDPNKHDAWAEKTHQHDIFIWETVNSLPEVFKPYIYFGDYYKK